MAASSDLEEGQVAPSKPVTASYRRRRRCWIITSALIGVAVVIVLGIVLAVQLARRPSDHDSATAVTSSSQVGSGGNGLNNGSSNNNANGQYPATNDNQTTQDTSDVSPNVTTTVVDSTDTVTDSSNSSAFSNQTSNETTIDLPDTSNESDATELPNSNQTSSTASTSESCQSWPDLMGADGNTAQDAILNASCGIVEAPILDAGSMVTMDYRVDRVWIFVDPDTNVVSQVPRVG